MMPNTPIVSRDLAQARRDMTEAEEHLGHSIYAEQHVATAELRRAIEATVRAITSVSLAVERLAELPACDGSHGA